MSEEQVITSEDKETIEETNTPDETPADNEDTADKADTELVDDPTSGDEDEENENYLGTFKTREDAVKGFKDAQSKITEQGNRIKELETKLNKQETNSMTPEFVEKRVQVVKQQTISEYNQRLEALGYKYGAYLNADAQINNEMDIIKNLPPEQSAMFVMELMNIQKDCQAKMQNRANAIYGEAHKAFEELKSKDKERYNNGKTGEMIFNAWYNPPQTIDDVAKLFEDYKALVIEDYIKEQAARKEDEKHKVKLNTNASGKSKFSTDHIFTSAEIGKMSNEEFAKYENVISQQVAAGLVK